jgi:hypothetical protein
MDYLDLSLYTAGLKCKNIKVLIKDDDISEKIKDEASRIGAGAAQKYIDNYLRKINYDKWEVEETCIGCVFYVYNSGASKVHYTCDSPPTHTCRRFNQLVQVIVFDRHYCNPHGKRLDICKREDKKLKQEQVEDL